MNKILEFYILQKSQTGMTGSVAGQAKIITC